MLQSAGRTRAEAATQYSPVVGTRAPTPPANTPRAVAAHAAVQVGPGLGDQGGGPPQDGEGHGMVEQGPHMKAAF